MSFASSVGEAAGGGPTAGCGNARVRARRRGGPGKDVREQVSGKSARRRGNVCTAAGSAAGCLATESRHRPQNCHRAPGMLSERCPKIAASAGLGHSLHCSTERSVDKLQVHPVRLRHSRCSPLAHQVIVEPHARGRQREAQRASNGFRSRHRVGWRRPGRPVGIHEPDCCPAPGSGRARGRGCDCLHGRYDRRIRDLFRYPDNLQRDLVGSHPWLWRAKHRPCKQKRQQREVNNQGGARGCEAEGPASGKETLSHYDRLACIGSWLENRSAGGPG